MHFSKGNRWEGERGREGGQYTANLGPEWTGICATTQRRDFQVSKGGISKQQKGVVRKGLGAYTSIYILC
jgi:hypothetical protein